MSYDPETQKYTGYIYYIENLINHKAYIGQTTRTINIRWKEHVYRAKDDKTKNQPFANSICKYGEENFEVKTLHVVTEDSREKLQNKLDNLEIESIKKYNTYIYNGNGYNVASGGMGGNGRTYRKITSYDINGNKLYVFDRYNEAAIYYGITVTTVSKICNGERYNYNYELVFRQDDDSFDKYPVLDPKENYGVYQFDKDGNLIGRYRSLNYASTVTGIRFESNEIIGDPHTLRGGYWWSYEPIFKYEGMSTKRQVDAYDRTTLKYLGTYPSIVECAEEYNIERRLICATCQGIQKTAGNMIFRYHGDPLDKYDYKTNRLGPKSRHVNKYSKSGEFIDTFSSFKEAKDNVGAPFSSGISACCRGEQKTAYGFKWYYAEDPNQPDKSKIIPNE